MFRPVLEDVHEGIANLTRRTENTRMIPVRPNSAAPGEDAVDGPSHANGQTLETAHEGRVSVSLDDEMHVIRLHAEVQEAKGVSRGLAERAANHAKDLWVAQRG